MTPKVVTQPLPQLPAAVPPPPAFAMNATDTRTPRKTITPSFLSSATLPSKANIGQKQLIGQ